MSFRAFLRRRFPNFKAPDFAKDPIDILIAGCGTGKHPIRTALRFRSSRVLAIDLSRASLAYADRMARKLGADNIEFAQADILALKGFERRFHLIEWGGALKHMEDPALGWDILRDLLVPGGFFRGGVFSERGRADAVRGREEIGKLGLTGDSSGIRAARDHLLNNVDETVREKLVGRPDFYAMSGCRELLFPTCERSFGLGDAAALIEKSGMRFVGVVAERPLQTAYAQANPTDLSLTDLEALQRFEAAQPELFFGRCQVVCQKPA